MWRLLKDEASPRVQAESSTDVPHSKHRLCMVIVCYLPLIGGCLYHIILISLALSLSLYIYIYVSLHIPISWRLSGILLVMAGWPNPRFLSANPLPSLLLLQDEALTKDRRMVRVWSWIFGFPKSCWDPTLYKGLGHFSSWLSETVQMPMRTIYMSPVPGPPPPPPNGIPPPLLTPPPPKT